MAIFKFDPDLPFIPFSIEKYFSVIAGQSTFSPVENCVYLSFLILLKKILRAVLIVIYE